MKPLKPEVHNLTQLQYEMKPDFEGAFRLYIYGQDGKHGGGMWFHLTGEKPDDNITSKQAGYLVKQAMAAKMEIRIVNGGDILVYHAKSGTTEFGTTFYAALMGEGV